MDARGIVRAVILSKAAWIFLQVAVSTVPPGVAVARIAIHQINTFTRWCCNAVPCEMHTRGRGTFVHVSFAVLAAEACHTLTDISVYVIGAYAFMAAWCTATLVHIFLAVVTTPAINTLADVLVDSVCATRSVRTRHRPTLVKVDLALKTNPPVRAGTIEGRDELVADATVHAWL
jgi:hypothetical protein